MPSHRHLLVLYSRNIKPYFAISDRYETEKIEYSDALRNYHNSPAYQAYLNAKNKVQAGLELEEKESSSKPKNEAKIVLQPAEDEEDTDDGFAMKHAASSRYQRNHRLINDIFSDTGNGRRNNGAALIAYLSFAIVRVHYYFFSGS